MRSPVVPNRKTMKPLGLNRTSIEHLVRTNFLWIQPQYDHSCPRRRPKSYLNEIWPRHLPSALESPVSVGPENVMQKRLMVHPWESSLPLVILTPNGSKLSRRLLNQSVLSPRSMRC